MHILGKKWQIQRESIMADGESLQEHAHRLQQLSFGIGKYRPPSEGGSASLLLRVSENCPWNRCTFCEMYKGDPFVYRPVEEIRRDIDAVAAIRDEIAAASLKLGTAEPISRELAGALLAACPDLRSNDSFIMVFNWLAAGGTTAYLQDANSIIMRPAEFVAVLEHLRISLKSLARVTSYARSKTLAHIRQDDLGLIRRAGLDRLHVGLETGDDELLARINKGVTQAEQIDGGCRAMAAGFQVSMYWMPDLGGRERWRQHAENTALALSAINPHYIRSRPLVPRPGTPLFDDVIAARLHVSSPHQRLEELALTIDRLEVNSKVCFDHAMNSWVDRRGGLLFRQGYEGYQFPEEKPLLLARIQEGLAVAESLHGDVRELMARHSL